MCQRLENRWSFTSKAPGSRLIRKQIMVKFRKYAPDFWWGDPFDVRFYLISELKKIREEKILDIGCGPGIILSEITGADRLKIGLDISKNVLKIAKTIGGDSQFVLGDMHHMPLRDNVFDCIIIANSFSRFDFQIDPKIAEIATPDRLVREVYRILNTSGKLFLTTPNKEHKTYKHASKVDYQTLCSLLQGNFHFSVCGFNPFPFSIHPLDKVGLGAFCMKILSILMKIRALKRRGKFFFVQAQKVQQGSCA